MSYKITILGDGSWGTAVATLCATNGYEVTLWCHNQDVANAIARTQENTCYLPGIKLSDRIKPTTNLKKAVEKATHVLQAIPVTFLRSILQDAAQHVQHDQSWISLSKGIEKNTNLLPSAIMTDVIGTPISTAIISGPSFAREVAQQHPTGMVVASKSAVLIQECKKILETDYCTLWPSEDCIGIEIGGAIKNIFALGAGIIAGAGHGDNTQALLITRGLTEIEKLCLALGGHKKSVYSVAGIGDLILTCTSEESRNYKTGKKRGQGQSISDYLETVSFVPEGINTITSIRELIHTHQIQAPILESIAAIILDDAPVKHLITALLQSHE